MCNHHNMGRRIHKPFCSFCMSWRKFFWHRINLVIAPLILESQLSFFSFSRGAENRTPVSRPPAANSTIKLHPAKIFALEKNLVEVDFAILYFITDLLI